MTLRSQFLITGCCLLLAACFSSKKDEQAEAPAPAQTPTPSSMAPGTVKAAALVLGHEEHEQHYLCRLKIQRVDSYGANTPPLPVGSEIEVIMPKTLFGDDPEGSVASEMLAPDHAVAVTLRHRLAPATEGPPPTPWRAVEIQ